MMRMVFFSSTATAQWAKSKGAARWFASLRDEWHAFRKSRPGERFEDRYCRKLKAGHTVWRKALSPVIGLMMIAIGLFLLPAPGPGLPVVMISIAIVAEQFLWAARVLDRCEPPLRTAISAAVGWWQHASAQLRRVVALITGLLALAAGALVFAVLA